MRKNPLKSNDNAFQFHKERGQIALNLRKLSKTRCVLTTTPSNNVTDRTFPNNILLYEHTTLKSVGYKKFHDAATSKLRWFSDPIRWLKIVRRSSTRGVAG